MKLMFANNWKENISNVSEFCAPTQRTQRKKWRPGVWRPVLVKIVVIKLSHKSVFSVTVLLFMSLLCIFIGGTIFFEMVAYFFLAA